MVNPSFIVSVADGYAMPRLEEAGSNTRRHGDPPSTRSDQVVAALWRLVGMAAHAGNAGDPVQTEIGEAIAMWLSSGDPQMRFDRALGLPRTWRMDIRLAERNRLIRELAEQWPNLSRRSLADKIMRCLQRYENGAFKRDYKSGRPAGIDGTLFDIVMAGQVPGIDRIRQVLDGG